MFIANTDIPGPGHYDVPTSENNTYKKYGFLSKAERFRQIELCSALSLNKSAISILLGLGFNIIDLYIAKNTEESNNQNLQSHSRSNSSLSQRSSNTAGRSGSINMGSASVAVEERRKEAKEKDKEAI